MCGMPLRACYNGHGARASAGQTEGVGVQNGGDTPGAGGQVHKKVRKTPAMCSSHATRGRLPKRKGSVCPRDLCAHGPGSAHVEASQRLAPLGHETEQSIDQATTRMDLKQFCAKC